MLAVLLMLSALGCASGSVPARQPEAVVDSAASTGPHAVTLRSPFEESESFRDFYIGIALGRGTRTKRPGNLFWVGVTQISHLMGGGMIRISALVCDKEKTVAVVKVAVQKILAQHGYRFDYPGWSDVGFLSARHRTKAKLFTAPPLFEDVHLIVKVDTDANSFGIITLIYEVTAGERENDPLSWSDRTTSIPVRLYMDSLTWEFDHAIVAAFTTYCGCVTGSGETYEQAMAKIEKLLDTEQRKDLQKRLRNASR